MLLVSLEFIIPSLHNYENTIPKKPNSSPRTCSQSSKGFDPRKDRYITVVAKQSRRSTSSHVRHLWLQRPLVRRYLQLLFMEGYA
ncbi:hypothetical protein TNCV_3708971 [Trichonephila clavipes]|nr:hypothetical protein TNCV_3708971 [Trichonephila clavipes]